MARTLIEPDEIGVNKFKEVTSHVGDIANGNRFLWSNALDLKFTAATAAVTVTITGVVNPYDNSTNVITQEVGIGETWAFGNPSEYLADGKYVNVDYTTTTGTVAVEALIKAR